MVSRLVIRNKLVWWINTGQPRRPKPWPIPNKPHSDKSARSHRVVDHRRWAVQGYKAKGPFRTQPRRPTAHPPENTPNANAYIYIRTRTASWITAAGPSKCRSKGPSVSPRSFSRDRSTRRAVSTQVCGGDRWCIGGGGSVCVEGVGSSYGPHMHAYTHVYYIYIIGIQQHKRHTHAPVPRGCRGRWATSASRRRPRRPRSPLSPEASVVGRLVG